MKKRNRRNRETTETNDERKALTIKNETAEDEIQARRETKPRNACPSPHPEAPRNTGARPREQVFFPVSTILISWSPPLHRRPETYWAHRRRMRLF